MSKNRIAFERLASRGSRRGPYNVYDSAVARAAGHTDSAVAEYDTGTLRPSQLHQTTITTRPRLARVLAVAAGFALVAASIGIVGLAGRARSGDPDVDPTNLAVAATSDDPAPQQSSRDAAFIELDAAAFAATECIENLGLRTQPPVYHEDTATFAFTWIPGSDEQQTAAQSCLDTVFEPVNAAWMAAYGPEPTPKDNTPSSGALSFDDVAALLKAEPITAAELERVIDLPSPVATSGYRVNQMHVADTTTELGLILYSDLSINEDGPAYTCFADYAEIGGVAIGGGAQCAPTIERAFEMAGFGIALSGACGPLPKDDPQIDGSWSLLSIWGIPNGVDAVAVELGDGSNVAVAVSDTGVAQMLWEDPQDITSIQFEGMTSAHQDYVSQLVPAAAIDCTPDNEGQG